MPVWFDEHQRRRDRGRGCISVIVGSPAENSEALAATGRPVACPCGFGLEAAVASYAGIIAESFDLPARALAALAIDDWDMVAPDDRARRIARSPADHPARHLAADLLLRGEMPPADTLDDLRVIVGLVADAALPILMIPIERITAEVGFLLALIEAVPRLPLVVLLTVDGAVDLDHLADRGDRVATVLRDGLVQRAPPVSGRLVPEADPLPAPVVLAHRPDQPASIFDSQAEALLSRLLEADPVTAGLFVPQGEPGFLMGNRQAARIDFLCKSLLIALEIDGPHHFEVNQYRRDRYKDLELQRAGYLVLRFLAEDVMEAGQIVQERIRSEVLWRAGRHIASDSV